MKQTEGKSHEDTRKQIFTSQLERPSEETNPVGHLDLGHWIPEL